MFGLLLFENPWLNGTDVGGLFFNLNLLGYAIPAVLAAALGLMTRRDAPAMATAPSRRSPRSCSR